MTQWLDYKDGHRPAMIKHYVCDNCGEGHMFPKNYFLPTDPPQFPHKCNNCGFETNLRKAYPTIE